VNAERAARYAFSAQPGASPFQIERAEGAYLIAPDGRRILDAAGGAVVVNIGHGRPEVAEAWARASEEATFVVPPFATPSRVRLVERLQDAWLPKGIGRCFFTSGGSEAVDAALRLALQHHHAAGRPERWKVIGREVSYHGTTIATLAVGGHLKRRAAFGPWFPDVPRAPACYCARCPLGLARPSCGVACADEVARVLDAAGPESVAAFIAEPMVGSSGGALVPPDEYWPRIAAVCRERGVLLIADEVMSGFGRTGRRFAVDHWDVVPDILVGGKGLTGGYAPMGAVFARDEVVAPLIERGEDLMFYTYSGHPATCAVADTVLEILERERLVERAAKLGERLGEKLATLADHPHVGDVRGRGLLQAVELVRDKRTLEPFPKETGLTGKVVGAGIQEGVFFYPAGTEPARDVIVLGPPFIIEENELDRIVEVLRHSIDAAVARVRERTPDQGA
jgi:adenosylmethionine-8-amino-7-oxononanoate aminotransferase